jgi:transcription termination factor Rho
MYDILQLNDMLVPELLDIAEQLNISDAKKSDKQDLIYKILDKQALPVVQNKMVLKNQNADVLRKAATANSLKRLK